MSVKTEMEAFRARIFDAWTNSPDNWRNKWPRETELPESLYDERQLKRWQMAEQVIRYSVREFLSEAGIVNHQLELDFSDHLRHPFSKEVEITLRFREDETEETWQEDKPFSKVSFVYDPGGRFTPESIHAKYAYIVAPKHYEPGASVTVDEASKWLEDDSINRFECVHIISPVDVNSLKNLLKVLVANPAVIAPTGGLVPREA